MPCRRLELHHRAPDDPALILRRGRRHPAVRGRALRRLTLAWVATLGLAGAVVPRTALALGAAGIVDALSARFEATSQYLDCPFGGTARACFLLPAGAPGTGATVEAELAALGARPARTDPARTDPARTDPARTEAARTEAARAGAAGAGPGPAGARPNAAGAPAAPPGGAEPGASHTFTAAGTTFRVVTGPSVGHPGRTAATVRYAPAGPLTCAPVTRLFQLASRASLTPLERAELSEQIACAPHEPSDGMGRTPLYLAAAAGNLDGVRDLLRAGADPNRRTLERHTPLLAAARHAPAALVEALLSAGADPSYVAPDGASLAALAPLNPKLAGRVGAVLHPPVGPGFAFDPAATRPTAPDAAGPTAGSAARPLPTQLPAESARATGTRDEPAPIKDPAINGPAINGPAIHGPANRTSTGPTSTNRTSTGPTPTRRAPIGQAPVRASPVSVAPVGTTPAAPAGAAPATGRDPRPLPAPSALAILLVVSALVARARARPRGTPAREPRGARNLTLATLVLPAPLEHEPTHGRD